jgi:4-amino-4-deoxy-L-arabinose transferase-like glycosyltransferase
MAFAAALLHADFPASVYWTLALVVACAAFAMAARGREWAVAAGWFALLVAGQACALQLIEVGPVIRLQIFFRWRDLVLTWRLGFLMALAAQFLLVAWCGRRWLPPFCPRWRQFFTWKTALVWLALMAYAGATIAPGVAQALVRGGIGAQLAQHSSKAALSLLIAFTGLLNLILAVEAIPAGALDRWRERWRVLAANPRLPWVAAAWVVVVSSLLAWFVLDRIPHVPDEAGYLFHARYLAAGKLYLESPPVPQAFNVPFYFSEGEKWYIAPPVGWPLVLALGALVGAPWLVNPLLGGLTVVLAHRLVRRMSGEEMAAGVALLTAASPWLLFMSASLMNHPLTLVLALVTLLGVERARNAGSLLGGAAAGLAVGGILQVRPLDAVLLAGVMALWWLSAGRRIRVAAMGATVIAGLALIAVFLAYNQALTGDPLLPPINKLANEKIYQGVNRLGFGKDVGNVGWVGLDALPGHGPIDVAMNTNHNLHLVQFELLGWMCGSLVLVFVPALWREWRRDALWWGIVLAICGGLNIYWFSGGPDFGARYWYAAFVPLLVLVWRGAETLAAHFEEPEARARVWALAALATLSGVLNVVPWRSLDKYKNYRGTRADIGRLAAQHHFGRALVFVRSRQWPDYACAVPYLPPRFDREAPGPLYVQDLGPALNEKVVRYYSDRPVWVLDGPTKSRGGPVRVAAGPLPPGTVPPPESSASSVP